MTVQFNQGYVLAYVPKVVAYITLKLGNEQEPIIAYHATGHDHAETLQDAISWLRRLAERLIKQGHPCTVTASLEAQPCVVIGGEELCIPSVRGSFEDVIEHTCMSLDQMFRTLYIKTSSSSRIQSHWYGNVRTSIAYIYAIGRSVIDGHGSNGRHTKRGNGKKH